MAVSKSTDNGLHWQRYTLAQTYSMCNALAINPIDSRVVYCGGYNSSDSMVFKTTDGGESWLAAGTGITAQVNDIAIDPVNPQVVYAAAGNGLYKTTNAGVDWSNTGCDGANGVVIDPVNPNIIYAGTNTGVFMSSIGGGSWTAMNDGLTDLLVTSIGIHANRYLFIGTNTGIYRYEIGSGTEENSPGSKARSITFFPNPFRTHTIIQYQVSRPDAIGLSIYDPQGRLVKHLLEAEQPAGAYSLSWDGKDQAGNRISSGIYFCKFTAGKKTSIHKLVVVE